MPALPNYLYGRFAWRASDYHRGVVDPSENSSPACVVVVSEDGLDGARERAVELSLRLALPLYEWDKAPVQSTRLVATRKRLEWLGPVGTRERPIFVDFVGGSVQDRRGTAHAGKELIARAVGFKREPLFILDATAGFARDAFVLAQLGCRVHAIERSPIVAALVEDGIDRARALGRPRILEALGRLTFECRDACAVLSTELRTPADTDTQGHLPDTDPKRPRELKSTAEWHGQAKRRHASSAEHGGQPQSGSDGGGRCPAHDISSPDVVYLDPMYPASRKSALSKKELRALRAIVGDDADAGELLSVSRRVARRRVVVKRPRHAPPLAPDPDVQYKGSSVRFDVYVVPTSR